MNNDELKKKIVEVVLNSEITGIQIRAITGGYSMANNIAEALIAAGMGDVKEEKFESDHYWRMWQGSLVELERAERRAEVAERALRNITERASCNICDNFSCRYYEGINFDYNAEDCIKWWLAQAEKELAEERKE